MVDLQESLPVPPMDPGGDERIGFRIAGSLLIVIGWGVGIILNLLLHQWAGASGIGFGQIRITAHLGEFAWATVGLGAFSGIFGVLLLWLARGSPPGPVVLPGYPY